MLSGGDPTKAVKVTPHIFATNYWGQDIISNPLFKESIKSSGGALLLIRRNPIDTIKSYVRALLTGEWHSDLPTAQGVNKFEEELLRFVTNTAIYIINSEIKIIKLVSSTQNNYKVFFYENITDNRDEFLHTFLNFF